MSSPATSRMRPAEAARRILSSIFRRRTPPLPDHDFEPPPVPEPRSLAPELHEAQGWLSEEVRGLTERGALDEGHGDLFDPLIDRLVDVWDTGRTRYHQAHLKHLACLDRAERDLRATSGWARRQEEQAAAVLAGTEFEIWGLLDETDEFERQQRERRQRRRTPRRQ